MIRRRVLITGAGGFAGSALSLGFAKLGWEVIALDRAFDDRPGHEAIRRVTVELTEGVPEAVPGVDLVVHAAWVTTDPETLGVTPDGYLALNLRPLEKVLEYATRTCPRAFVFVSSSGVFAAEDAVGGLTDADQPTGASPYAVAKLAGESLVQTSLDHGTAVHVVRLGYLFGPGEMAIPSRLRVSLVAAWVAAARAGEPLVVRSDDPVRDWTFTADLAGALERLADEAAAGRPIHLGSPHACSDSEFVELIARVVPAATRITQPAGGQVKPPMVPSDVAALRDFQWTDPAAGLQLLLTEEVAA
jgi:UDP-glucose 4-epimerase